MSMRLRINSSTSYPLLRDTTGTRQAARFTGGFSLVEVLVAMVIGLIGVVVMMQMFSLYEGRRRTAMSVDDAIGTGAVTLYRVQRDMQHSGWGFAAPQMIGCSIAGLVSGGGSVPLVPVVINSPLFEADKDPNTETLMIISGNGNGSVEGERIQALSGTSVSFGNSGAFKTNEVAVFVKRDRPAGCGVTRDQVTGTAPPVVNLSVGPVGLSTTFAQNDSLFNLGATPSVRVYRVRNQTLTVCDFMASNCTAGGSANNAAIWVPIANNIVSLRAQYGRDTDALMNGGLDVWDRTAPVPAAKAGYANFENGCAWLRVQAVRIALVARSSQPEKRVDGSLDGSRAVTPTVPVWAGSDDLAVALDATEAADVGFTLPSPSPTWPTWQDFRYKVFQTIVPLRNITIQGVPAEC